jgi:hypothetical protein
MSRVQFEVVEPGRALEGVVVPFDDVKRLQGELTGHAPEEVMPRSFEIARTLDEAMTWHYPVVRLTGDEIDDVCAALDRLDNLSEPLLNLRAACQRPV